MLEAAGYDVVGAENGNVALDGCVTPRVLA
jgi:hypothetical protein